MADDDVRPMRLMSFVSEEELENAKKTRGERPEDGTAQRDRPLFEILRENKDKKDAEFSERFKHRPPKALDEDETEFLEKMEMSRREYERQVENEDAQQLRSFQEAVAAQMSIVHELKETSIPTVEEKKPVQRKNQHARPLGGLIISVKPRAKKAKTDTTSNNTLDTVGESKDHIDEKHPVIAGSALGGLVSYSDESDDDN
ncbi:hypothetical protein QJS10_CPB17g00867 [Acorus calamus]|uniref:FAM192A/Fyv6 N-terminal domain-containing protein n=1 Tax=Acorus calamus TaxID=4465 RepID=A0AAV9CV42_ACOCL|nr:hypothetical protein QJS10_CPB17g00867 [Acorus calamus]